MIKSQCLYCGKQFSFCKNQKTGKYCSNKCQQLYQSEQKVKNGTAGWVCLRNYIKRRAKGRCEICGIDSWLGKPIVLICDHINGDPSDNRLENLRAICSNCDSTLPTYKARNKGNGRSYRRSASQALR